MSRKQKKTLRRIIITAVLLVAMHFVEHAVEHAASLPFDLPGDLILFVLYMVPYLLIGYDILRKAALNIRNGQVFDENFLMVTATIGAIGMRDFEEGVAVMFFYQIGEFFQSYAVGRSRKNISELMDIRPDHANIMVDGELTEVDPNTVEIGTEIYVRTGEKVPIDGVVVEGETSLNTAALTGESLPRDVAEGDEVISGCINLTGLIKVRTTKVFGESTASKILELVENSGMNKSQSEAFITKFAKYYTPIVCFSALAVAILPPLIRMFFLHTAPLWSMWVFRALTFLVISCPCALVISIPLSFFAGIGGASRNGILVKGANYLEALSKTATVVFDKTGTVTKGIFEVAGVHHCPLGEQHLLEFAAHAECFSNHPIAQSLRKAYKGEIDESRVTGVREFGGHGVIAEVGGVTVIVGSEKLMADNGINYAHCRSVGSVVHVAIDGAYFGHILIHDTLKPTSRDAIAALKKIPIRKLVMLTGDQKAFAEEIAKEVGIDDVRSELLPEDKVREVSAMLEKEDPKKVLAFVGDGINDAPVLARADIGIAMGALGADAAIEAADIVLMDDDPLKISKAIRISKKCMGIVYQNIVFAIGVKVLALILSAFGIVGMWMAIFADVGVMIIAVINAMRALYVKNE